MNAFRQFYMHVCILNDLPTPSPLKPGPPEVSVSLTDRQSSKIAQIFRYTYTQIYTYIYLPELQRICMQNALRAQLALYFVSSSFGFGLSVRLSLAIPLPHTLASLSQLHIRRWLTEMWVTTMAGFVELNHRRSRCRARCSASADVVNVLGLSVT